MQDLPLRKWSTNFNCGRLESEVNKVSGVGEVGELCVRGPQVMKGYWNLASATANSLRPDPEGGAPWLHTGENALQTYPTVVKDGVVYVEI